MPTGDRTTTSSLTAGIRARFSMRVFQLAQALKDYAADQPIRAVDESGQPKRLSDNSGDQVVSDIYLRGEFPPHGKARAQRPGDTPLDHFRNRLGDFSRAVERLTQAYSAVAEVLGDDGRPLTETYGVDGRDCNAWREEISQIDEELVVWGRTFKRVNGLKFGPTGRTFTQSEEDLAADIDVYADEDSEEDEVSAG
jgi:hypothetical protein